MFLVGAYGSTVECEVIVHGEAKSERKPDVTPRFLSSSAKIIEGGIKPKGGGMISEKGP